MKIICKNCINFYAKDEKCSEDIWDRNDEDQDWLHDDVDYDEYLTKDRFCSEFTPKTID